MEKNVNELAVAGLRKTKNIINLIACEVCCILIALMVDCLIFFNLFNRQSTPIILIAVLAVLWVATFVGRRYWTRNLEARERDVLGEAKYSDKNGETSVKAGKNTRDLGPNFRANKPPVSKTIKEIIYHVVGVILSLIFLFPILYMLATSTKTEVAYAESIGTINMFIPNISSSETALENYKSVLINYDIWKYALNSLLYAAIVIVLNVIVNGLAGYVMAKLRFPGKKMLSFLIIFLIVVPVETSIIPLYSIVKIMLGLKQRMSVWGVILPAAISIFNIFLFMQFFQNIPKEYEEAARIDGATTLGVFSKVIMPLSKPIIATVAVFCFIGVWNDYLWPSMILPSANDGSWPLLPIQTALMSIQNIEGITTGEIMASLVITSIPIFIIYVAAQKYIVKGFGTAGLKM